MFSRRKKIKIKRNEEIILRVNQMFEELRSHIIEVQNNIQCILNSQYELSSAINHTPEVCSNDNESTTTEDDELVYVVQNQEYKPSLQQSLMMIEHTNNVSSISIQQKENLLRSLGFEYHSDDSIKDPTSKTQLKHSKSMWSSVAENSVHSEDSTVSNSSLESVNSISSLSSGGRSNVPRKAHLHSKNMTFIYHKTPPTAPPLQLEDRHTWPKKKSCHKKKITRTFVSNGMRVML